MTDRSKYFLLTAFLVASFWAGGCHREQPHTVERRDASGYRYTESADDPLHVRIYTLDNGLKVYLSKNPSSARIYTSIGVRAGLLHDPPHAAGTTDYLQYLMFQGTKKYGTCDYKDEEPLLEATARLLEQYRNTRSYHRKKALFRQIDSVSLLADRYAVPDEYWHLANNIDVRNIQIFSSFNHTLYTNNIPVHELQRWAELESQRFKEPVFRRITEGIRQITEDHNRRLRDDNYRAQQALLAMLFPGLPFEMNVAGFAEQIANPSLQSIQAFYDQYYLPGNMALALAGVPDFEGTIRTIDRYFGSLQPKKAEIPQPLPAQPFEGPVERTVSGPSAESVLIGFRFDGAANDNEKYVTLIDRILNDDTYGLLVNDLKKKHKVQIAGCGLFRFQNHIIHTFYVAPLPGQSLSEAKELLLGEIEKIKKGDFAGWLPEAAANNLHRSFMERMAQGPDRSGTMMEAFFQDVPWDRKVGFYHDLGKITQKELVRFAREHYAGNYVVIYKRRGIPDRIRTAAIPKFSQTEHFCQKHSDFYRKFTAEKVTPPAPLFIDFHRAILHDSLRDGLRIDFIPNRVNDLFTLEYRFDMGRDNDLLLSLALGYLPYLGTEKYSPAAFQEALYRLGLELSVRTSSRHTWLRLSGPQSSFAEGVRLLDHIVHHASPAAGSYRKYVDHIVRTRRENKGKSAVILQGALLNYGRFGKDSPFTHLLPEEEIRKTAPEQLTGLLHDLFRYRHTIFYYGPEDLREIKSLVEQEHRVPKELKDPTPARHYTERKNTGKIFFVPWDRKKSYLLMVAQDVPFDLSPAPQSALFNELYGPGPFSPLAGMIRTGQLPAQTVYARYEIPEQPGYSNYLYVMAETGSGEMAETLHTLPQLLSDVPLPENTFTRAKETLLARIRKERITGTEVYYTWLENREQGTDHDLRKDVFSGVEKMTPGEMKKFLDEHVRGKEFTFLILGNREDAGIQKILEKYVVEELSLKEVFGY